MADTTTISKWGNSEAVRIPKDILRTVGLCAGDKVRISAEVDGSITIKADIRPHRRIKPLSGITFESLFKDYKPSSQDTTDAWENEDMIGAEAEAWSD